MMGNVVRRFALRPGTLEPTIVDVSRVAVAVIMYHGAVAKLIEVVESGEGEGSARSVFWDIGSGKARYNPLGWYEAVSALRRATSVVRYVRHRVEARGRVMIVIELCPPFEDHRYAEIEFSADELMSDIDLPSWLGRDISEDGFRCVYGVVAEAHRLRRQTGIEVLP